MPSLDDFLETLMDVPFIWGKRDCILFPADWVWQVVGRDPAEDYRGTYKDAQGAADLIEAHGDMLDLAEYGLASVGCSVTTAPVRGDVGILRARTREDYLRALSGWTGGICLGDDQWITAAPKGFVMGRAACLVAWSVGEGR